MCAGDEVATQWALAPAQDLGYPATDAERGQVRERTPTEEMTPTSNSAAERRSGDWLTKVANTLGLRCGGVTALHSEIGALLITGIRRAPDMAVHLLAARTWRTLSSDPPCRPN